MKSISFISLTIITFIMLSTAIKSQITKDELEDILKEAREKFKLPSVASVVLNSKEILISDIQGVCNYNSNKSATLQNFYHIGSCSKSVLTNIAGKLIEEGKINWETKFFDIYPELKEGSKIDYHNITLIDLFLCQAGIKPFISGEEKLPQFLNANDSLRYEFAKYLISLDPSSSLQNGIFEFNYSNAGYTLAALMLEKVSGLTYEQLIEKYIIKELEIPTWFGFPNKIDSKQPWGYMISEDDLKEFSPENEYCLPYILQPAGDLSMTPLGFARFIQCQLIGLKDGNEFLTKEMYHKIHYGYRGFAIGVANNEMESYKFSGMDGSAGTFFCRAIIIPEADFAFTINTNAGSGTGEMEAIDWITMKIVKKHFNWWWKFWL